MTEPQPPNQPADPQQPDTQQPKRSCTHIRGWQHLTVVMLGTWVGGGLLIFAPSDPVWYRTAGLGLFAVAAAAGRSAATQHSAPAADEDPPAGRRLRQHILVGILVALVLFIIVAVTVP